MAAGVDSGGGLLDAERAEDLSANAALAVFSAVDNARGDSVANVNLGDQRIAVLEGFEYELAVVRGEPAIAVV